jgi:predicted restriction endonuclease
MEKLENIYNAIGEWSERLINDAEAWSKQLGGSKNYVCTPDLKQWTYGKSVAADGEYDYDGGVAKNRLYNLGFKNVLAYSNRKIKEQVKTSFVAWAEKVQGYPIIEKFNADQLSGQRFELLVHTDILEKLIATLLTKKDHQQEFDEGFRKEIIIEVAKRNKLLLKDAKEKYGTICAVCEFDFAEIYPGHGDGFIEIHHLHPIAKGRRASTVEDVRPVCANCHRMLHRGEKILSITELKNIIVKK